MKIYNSLVSDYTNIEKKEFNIYCCGPTVYNYIHIGNARPSILMDVVTRYLKSKDIKVNFLQNITDVDDKIIQKAIDENKTEKEISEFYSQAFINDLKSLNVNMPTKLIPISEEMDGMIEFINDLVKSDDAYVVDGDVYFDIKKWESKYGQLSGRKIDELISGERIAIDNKKRNSLDFTLWKKTDKGIKWESPFGLGRPGWHTECVLLIDKYFNGETIDIHAGGIDLKFPHHENERIQFFAHKNKELANIWMHNGHLNMDGEKMSKSLGNVILVKDFVKQYSGNVLRWIFLTSSYRQPLNINDDLILQGQKFFDKLNNLKKTIIKEIVFNNFTFIKNNNIDGDTLNLFDEFMQDDFNTPRVLTLIESLIKEINVSNVINSTKLNELIFILETLGFENVLNLNISDEDKLKMIEWKKLINEKYFDQADKLREELQMKGIL